MAPPCRLGPACGLSRGVMLSKGDTVAINAASTRHYYGRDGDDCVVVENCVIGWQGTVSISSRCWVVSHALDSETSLENFRSTLWRIHQEGGPTRLASRPLRHAWSRSGRSSIPSCP